MYDWLRERDSFFWVMAGMIAVFVVFIVVFLVKLQPPDGCYYVVTQGDNHWRVTNIDYNIGSVTFEKNGARVTVSGEYTVREYGCRR